MIGIDFSNKTYVVTGGNKGLGNAIAKDVARAGGNVVMLSRSEASAAADAIAKEFNVKAKSYQCDVGIESKVDETFAQIIKDFGEVAGVVCNAGVSVPKPAFEQNEETFDYIMKINVLGSFNIAKAAAKKWVETGYKKGSIVMIASMSSQIYNVQGPADPLRQVFYNASKAAVSSVAKGLAAEWIEHGIRVNIASPGFIKTDQTQGMDPKILNAQSQLVPMKRFSEPSEQASPVVFLLSELASYMTGSEVFVDGGFLIY
ncbi:hypothetical protein E3P92_02687 [Wallemia ichthyophaga]|uniref:NADP-dependent mannitol dehydrogenase n=2 Tax=Wallemia ichthyophaga TaxID=245174 RepID=A0A4T0F0A7_WALIC|nr:putative NADP-dependent mannitol dehydrogenase [Wallemia ichthyophaga EXF-994]TIA70709.1 hypothetical protein E3P91_02960 [Wallemia ichthyophaga]EOQ99146.1 putative NADP-dependent mannitol dehydrogenase [Wallemia ichthyophaga EXF-994]TIA80006.1 hypothetical protein E3P98_02953 [Wallemia ichthyophaga]TIA88945.1 hypothetical protein E3P97_03304 [Wallemia ichthyophaga]TIA97810.1 hypothetical protein E3P94_03187 [Wallemia ichthyophaga]